MWMIMNEEQAFALMMDALDGVLDESDSAELNRYLTHHPDLAAEWDAMQAVDNLLRESPPAVVPTNFSERTLARLPNPRARRIFMAMFFILLFLGGLIPVALGIYTISQGSLATAGIDLSGGFQVVRVLIIGISSAVRSLVVTQPVIYAWLTTMLLSILLWVQTYRSAMNNVTLQPISVRI